MIIKSINPIVQYKDFECDYIDIKQGSLVKDKYNKAYGVVLKCGDNAWKPVLVYWMGTSYKEYTLTCNLDIIQ